MDFSKARFNMVEQQVRPWDVLDPRVLDVIGILPREHFVPPQYRGLAYSDTRIPLNAHSKMLNPNIEGRILQHLNVTEDDLVLEIGTGSGYLTACLARLARHVDTVEIDEALAETARDKLADLDIDNVNITEGDASHGWEQKRAYDVIVITGSLPDIPQEYKELLSIGGRLFVVTGYAPAMTARLVTRTAADTWEIEDVFETCIDRLDGSDPDPDQGFVF